MGREDIREGEERGEPGGWMERWGGAFSPLLSCVRIGEFLPRLGQKKKKNRSKLVEERDASLSACRANLRAGTFPQVSSQAFNA